MRGCCDVAVRPAGPTTVTGIAVPHVRLAIVVGAAARAGGVPLPGARVTVRVPMEPRMSVTITVASGGQGAEARGAVTVNLSPDEATVVGEIARPAGAVTV